MTSNKTPDTCGLSIEKALEYGWGGGKKSMTSDLVKRAQERAESYRLGGPSAEHTAALLDEMADRIVELEGRVQSLNLYADLSAAKARREALEEAILTVLEQRCERGTSWDLACVTAAQAIRKLMEKKDE